MSNEIAPHAEKLPHAKNGRAICGAKTRNGTPCKGKPMANGRCRMHGGTSLGGLASPVFKTGRYSKYLPARMAERYQESLKDPEILALNDEIALADSRLEDLLKRVDTGESGAIWELARSAYKNLLVAQSKKDYVKMAEALQSLGEIIQRGQADYAAWQDVSIVMEQRRRLVESERKRRVDMQQMITVDRAMLLIGAISDILKRNIEDRNLLNKISRELQSLLVKREAEGGE